MANSGFQKLDLYGQSIKFSYNNSGILYSCWGIIISLLAVILILVYSILFILDGLKLSKPNVLSKIENYLIAPKIYMIPDLTGYFDVDSPLFNITKEEKVDTTFMQVSFGLQDMNTLEIYPFDPSYFYLNISYLNEFEQNSDVQNTQLFFDNCRRFPFFSKTLFDQNKINEMYCVYSPFITHGKPLSKYFKAFSMSLHKCQNNSLVKIEKQDLKEFNRLKYVYDQLRSQSILDSRVFFKSMDDKSNEFNDESFSEYSNRAQSLTKVNTNLKNLKEIDEASLNVGPESWPNPYVTRYNSQDNKSPIICKSEDEIKKRIIETRIIFQYLENEFNTTNPENLISTHLNQMIIYHNFKINKETTISFQNEKILSYNSLIPPSMLNRSTIDYFTHKSEYTQFLFGDPSNDHLSSFFDFKIESSIKRTIYDRTYMNFLDILGIIGGVSKLLIIAGFCLVFKYAYVRMKEAIINETYNVIDPKNMKKLNRTYDEFIKEISENKDIYIANKFKDQTYLEEFFCSILDDIKLAEEEKDRLKYEILYEVFKSGAYSGFSYNTWEIIANQLLCCCLTKRLKHKNMTFNKALKELEKDNDFRSIFKAVQEFDKLKKCFLDEGQCNLLNGIANPAITWQSTAKKNKINTTNPKKTVTHINNENKQETSKNKHHLEKMNALKNALDEIFKREANNETDSTLLNSLINNEALKSSVNELRERKSEYEQKERLTQNNKRRDDTVKDLNEKEINNMISIFH
jgi:hypothetical protein